MIYIKLRGVVAFLCIGSNLSSMHSLRELAAGAILKEKDGNLVRTIEERNPDAHQYVRRKCLQDNLGGFWEAIPENISLVRLSQGFPIRALSFLGASSSVVVVSRTGKLVWWDTTNLCKRSDNTIIPSGELETGHKQVTAFAISPEGDYFATAGDNLVKVWEARSFSCIQTIEQSGVVSALSLSDYAREIVIGDERGKLLVCSMDESKPSVELCQTFFAGELHVFNRVLATRLCADGQTLVSAGYYVAQGNVVKPVVRVWDRSTQLCRREVVIDCTAIMGKVVILDDTRVLTSFTNGTIFLTNLARETTEKITCEGYAVEASVLSHDGRFLLTGCQNNKVVLWQHLEDRYEKLKEFQSKGILLNHCAFRADGSVLLAGSSLGEIDMWSVEHPFNKLSIEEAQAQLKKARVSRDGNDAPGRSNGREPVHN